MLVAPKAHCRSNELTLSWKANLPRALREETESNYQHPWQGATRPR